MKPRRRDGTGKSCSRQAWAFLPTPFLVLFGATYFFAEFGPNTTTFVYPAEIFPVRVRTTAHGVAAAAGKAGAFIGDYALTWLLPAIGLGETSVIVAVVAVLGAIVTFTTLPSLRARALKRSPRLLGCHRAPPPWGSPKAGPVALRQRRTWSSNRSGATLASSGSMTHGSRLTRACPLRVAASAGVVVEE